VPEDRGAEEHEQRTPDGVVDLHDAVLRRAEEDASARLGVT
jgi:hypothetical protein